MITAPLQGICRLCGASFFYNPCRGPTTVHARYCPLCSYGYRKNKKQSPEPLHLSPPLTAHVHFREHK